MSSSFKQPGLLQGAFFGENSLGIESFLASVAESYASLLCILGILAFLSAYLGQMKYWLKQHFTSTVYVRKSDETYDMLSMWILNQGLDTAARSSIARVDLRKVRRRCNHVDTKKPLYFAPWEGSFFFHYRNTLLAFRTEMKDVGLNKEEEISITCLGRSSEVLRALLRESRDYYLSEVDGRTTVFENVGNSWKKAATTETRPLSTIVLSEQQETRLIDDMKHFLNPDTQSWFAKRAIPYRRGYLFYGPPGTGKSSFSLSVAGELDLDIYILSIPSVNDQSLRDLFAKLPDRCVVLLEDIDAVGTSRSGPFVKRDQTPSGWSGTLSGLLNVLDGVASQEGRILLMTTNHVEELDEALIRPGRIDMKTEFRLVDSNMAARLYSLIFECEPAEKVDKANDALRADILAETFASKLPSMEFSPAEVMSYLLQHRKSPKAAVDCVNGWVLTTRRQRQGTAVSGAT